MQLFETALVRGPRFLVEKSEEWGVDRNQLLREAGLRKKQIEEPEVGVTRRNLLDLWRAVIFHFPERDLGVRLGAAFDLRRAGLLGFLLLNASGLKSGLERLVRHSRILNEEARLRLQIEAERVVVAWTPSAFFRPYPQTADWALAALVTSLRQASGTRLWPKEVWVPYAKPSRGLPSLRALVRAPLHFDRDEAGLVLSHRQMDLPTRHLENELEEILAAHAAEVAPELAQGRDLVAKTIDALRRELPKGRPALERVAATLKVGARALQHRLHGEGETFKRLLDQLLRSLALSLLADRRLAVHEIAFVLGYSEPGTFHRAFKRWHDTGPEEYRASQ